MSTHGEDVVVSENDACTMLREKHLQMVMDVQQSGREVPAKPVYASVCGEDVARQSVEASQRTMRQSTKRSFLIPALPWHRTRNPVPLENITA